MTTRPNDTEYAPAYSAYVSLVPETDALSVLDKQAAELTRLATAVPADRETFRYAVGKWSIREVFGHVIDTERVFGYRAFCISRGEQAGLPAFDENDYVRQSDFHNQPLEKLAVEFKTVRDSNLPFLRRLDDQILKRFGTASGKPISVRALLFIMAGHVRHHCNVLHERYDVPIGR